MQFHMFDINIAEKYGIEEAILFQNLAHWVEVNRSRGSNFINGKYWTFNTSNGFQKLFPYMSAKKIQRLLKRLEECGLVLSGRYNDTPYDRTKWYTLSDVGERLAFEGGDEQEGLFDETNLSSGNGQECPNNINTNIYKSIYITNINTNINIDTLVKQDKIIHSWNDMAEDKGLTPIQKISAKSMRYKNMKRRIDDTDVETVEKVIHLVGESDFLTGHNESGWVATFDWVMKPSNFEKVLEGNYTNKKPVGYKNTRPPAGDTSDIDSW